MNAAEIAAALGGKKGTGETWQCHCPAHEDKNPSFTVKDDGGKTLVYCHTGCSQHMVIEALKARGLWTKVNGTDTFKPKGIRARHYDKPLCAWWEYRDQDHITIGYTARYQSNADDKEIIPYFKRSGDMWETGGPDGGKPIYGAEYLKSDKPVLIVEGEKAADAARSLVGHNFICISWMGGTSSADKVNWTLLQGREIFIWPDKDEPGTRAANKILAKLPDAKIITPPETVPLKWDLADALIEGWTHDGIIKHIEQNSGPVPGPWDKPVDVAGMMRKIPDPIPWLFNQRLPAGRGALLTGLGGSSKTTVLRTMAFGVVLQEMPWEWEVDRTGKAVLVLTEDTAADVHRFIHYAARDLEEHQKRSIAENLFIYPLAGQDTILMHQTSNGTVERTPLFYALQKKIQDLGNVVFVGLDPALSITEGQELDQGHQRALGKMADDLAVNTGASVLLVSHSTKGSLLTEELQSHSSRGGGAITDAVRAEFVLRNMTAKEASKANITDVEERHRHVQLVCTKGNNIPPAARVPVWLRRDDFGNLSEVDIILDEKNTVTDSDIAIIKTHIEMSKHATVKLADWRAKCVERGLVSGETESAQKKAMQRTIKKLKALGLLADGIGTGIYVVTILGKATQ